MALSTSTILGIAQVLIQLRTLRSDYESSAKYCADHGKDSGLAFNTRRVNEIDTAIAILEKAVASK